MSAEKTEGGNGKRRRSDRANIYDVASEAGVSFVTVSRVFNDHPNVSDAMRERVFNAARAVGYSPKLVSRPRVIGLLLGDMTKLTGRTDKSALCTMISSAAAKREFMVQFIPLKQADIATKRLVDGLIEIDLAEEQLRSLEKIPNVPVVLTHNRTVNPQWSTVTIDFMAEGRLACSTLTGMGHNRIAVVLDQRSGWTSEQRIAGMLEHLTPLGCKLGTKDIFELSSHSVLDIARTIADRDYTAVICFASDQASMVADAFINVLGVRIPDDLSFINLDNSQFSRHFNPRLSSIEQPLGLIAEKAVEELVRLLNGKESRGRNIELRSQLQLRDSALPLVSAP